MAISILSHHRAAQVTIRAPDFAFSNLDSKFFKTDAGVNHFGNIATLLIFTHDQKSKPLGRFRRSQRKGVAVDNPRHRPELSA
jgi:hypothetical protein